MTEQLRITVIPERVQDAEHYAADIKARGLVRDAHVSHSADGKSTLVIITHPPRCLMIRHPQPKE